MLTREELEKSPLFRDISYESYLLMIDCFHAVHKSYRGDEVIYDFAASGNNSVGLVERGSAALIRIDEEGVSTVMAHKAVLQGHIPLLSDIFVAFLNDSISKYLSSYQLNV